MLHKAHNRVNMITTLMHKYIYVSPIHISWPTNFFRTLQAKICYYNILWLVFWISHNQKKNGLGKKKPKGSAYRFISCKIYFTFFILCVYPQCVNVAAV